MKLLIIIHLPIDLCQNNMETKIDFEMDIHDNSHLISQEMFTNGYVYANSIPIINQALIEAVNYVSLNSTCNPNQIFQKKFKHPMPNLKDSKFTLICSIINNSTINSVTNQKKNTHNQVQYKPK